MVGVGVTGGLFALWYSLAATPSAVNASVSWVSPNESFKSYRCRRWWLISYSPTVDLQIEGAFMCVNRDYHRNLSTVKVQIVDPTGRNPIWRWAAQCCWNVHRRGLSLPAIPFILMMRVNSTQRCRFAGTDLGQPTLISHQKI